MRDHKVGDPRPLVHCDPPTSLALPTTIIDDQLPLANEIDQFLQPQQGEGGCKEELGCDDDLWTSSSVQVVDMAGGWTALEAPASSHS